MQQRSNMSKAAFAVGAVFLLVGILGFIPGITTNYDQMTFAGPESDAMLLGIFEVSVLHNIVHLLFGVVGLAAAKMHSSAYQYLLYGGLTYLVLFAYGILVDKSSGANFVPLNTADDVLHLFLSVAMVGLAVALRRAPETRTHRI